MKYADFHLLLYLFKVLDLDTVFMAAEAVANEKPLSEAVELLVSQHVNF